MGAPATDALPLEARDFLTWLRVERGRAPSTLSSYARDLRRYCGWLAACGTGLDEVSEDQIVGFLRRMQGEPRAAASVARTMVAVRSLHRYLAAEEVRSDDPTAGVELPRVPRGLPKALAEADVERLLDAVEGDTPAARRDRAILEVLYGTGVRISELVGLSLRDVDLDAALMRVLGKGSKERVVPLGRHAHRSLVEWLQAPGRGELEPERWATRDDAEAVFLNRRGRRLSRQGAWGVVKKHGAQVGLGARLTPHVLRHSCATHMLDHGADVRTVQELLGHASVTTTQVYTKVSQERLWQVYAEAHPRAKGR